jgi:hypothetical protein
MMAAWGGSGLPDVVTFLFWVLPGLSLPVFCLSFAYPRIAVAALWSLLLAAYSDYFAMCWRSCSTGHCTTTNPFAIAAGCLYGSLHIPALLIAAASLHFAVKARSLSAALT